MHKKETTGTQGSKEYQREEKDINGISDNKNTIEGGKDHKNQIWQNCKETRQTNVPNKHKHTHKKHYPCPTFSDSVQKLTI